MLIIVVWGLPLRPIGKTDKNMVIFYDERYTEIIP